jgi:hypothetical protein
LKEGGSETESKVVDILSLDETNVEADSTINSECVLSKFKLKHKSFDLNDEVNTTRACCFMSNWRHSLCKCSDCLTMYKENRVDYLTDANDTINFYEEYGKKKEAEIDENKLLNDQLNKLDRVAQVEFLHNFNDFKQELTEFLTGFAQNGQVVS